MLLKCLLVFTPQGAEALRLEIAQSWLASPCIFFLYHALTAVLCCVLSKQDYLCSLVVCGTTAVDGGPSLQKKVLKFSEIRFMKGFKEEHPVNTIIKSY